MKNVTATRPSAATAPATCGSLFRERGKICMGRRRPLLPTAGAQSVRDCRQARALCADERTEVGRRRAYTLMVAAETIGCFAPPAQLVRHGFACVSLASLSQVVGALSGPPSRRDPFLCAASSRAGSRAGQALSRG